MTVKYEFQGKELHRLCTIISQQATEDLLTMVTTRSADYHEQALELAQAELLHRGVSLPEEADGYAPELAVAEREQNRSCKGSGAELRFASLLGDKEIVLSFFDNHAQRFLEVLVRQRCRKVTFTVDFDTEVQGWALMQHARLSPDPGEEW